VRSIKSQNGPSDRGDPVNGNTGTFPANRANVEKVAVHASGMTNVQNGTERCRCVPATSGDQADASSG
jgi:hypothetical protein